MRHVHKSKYTSLRSTDNKRRERHFDLWIPHAHAQIRIGTESEGLDENAAIQRNTVQIDLLFDVLSMYAIFLEASRVGDVKQASIGYRRHDLNGTKWS